MLIVIYILIGVHFAYAVEILKVQLKLNFKFEMLITKHHIICKNIDRRTQIEVNLDFILQRSFVGDCVGVLQIRTFFMGM